MSAVSPQKQLDAFIDAYSPEIAARARQALTTVRALLPGPVELVYDNYNALVIGFSPTERPSHAICSIALYPRWVNLYFLAGAGLPDPEGILKGSGKIVRYITLKEASDLDRPAVRALFAHAIADADEPFDPRARRRLIIRAVSAKQRPRRR